MLRKINLSAAIIVLVCFFLPWVQVSCAGAKDTLSGLGLARQDDVLLWLIPLVMTALLVFVLLRVRPARPQLLGLLSTFGGVIVLVLMNRERMRAHNESGLIAAQLTGWFWLGLIAAAVVVVSGIAILLRKTPAPGNQIS
jgi:predicted Co/Zn/Cd cation transporter (cation efflux family)